MLVQDIGNACLGSRETEARLIINTVVIEGRAQADVAAAYCVSKSWVSELLARYRAEGEAAFEPTTLQCRRSRKKTVAPRRLIARTS